MTQATFNWLGTEECDPDTLRKLKRTVIIVGQTMDCEITTTRDGQALLNADQPEDLVKMQEVLSILAGHKGLGFQCKVLG